LEDKFKNEFERRVLPVIVLEILVFEIHFR